MNKEKLVLAANEWQPEKPMAAKCIKKMQSYLQEWKFISP